MLRYGYKYPFTTRSGPQYDISHTQSFKIHHHLSRHFSPLSLVRLNLLFQTPNTGCWRHFISHAVLHNAPCYLYSFKWTDNSNGGSLLFMQGQIRVNQSIILTPSWGENQERKITLTKRTISQAVTRPRSCIPLYWEKLETNC